MAARPPERGQGLCMATAEDRRVRLQSYADAKTLDRRLQGERGRRRNLDFRLGRIRGVLSAARARRSGPRAPGR